MDRLITLILSRVGEAGKTSGNVMFISQEKNARKLKEEIQ